VLLENFRPGVMERLGYGWEALHARDPRLIYGAVSGFGHTGPDARLPAYDMVVQGRGGVMSITGEAGRDPVRVGASIGDIVAGMFLMQGVLAALIARDRTGRGQKIDVAMLDGQLAILEHAIAITTLTGTSPGRTGARHPTIAPFETYRAADGLLVIAAGNDTIFARLCAALGLGPLDRDPRFDTNAARCENVKLLKRLIETVTLTASRDHWMAVLEAAGVPTGPIQDIEQVLADPQILARNMVVELATASAWPATRSRCPSFPTTACARPPRRSTPTGRQCSTGWRRNRRPRAEPRPARRRFRSGPALPRRGRRWKEEAEMVDASQIREDMEVVGADGVHVGKVDHMEGDRVKLARKDEAHGVRMEHHHYVPLSAVASVDGGKVWLSANASEARILMQERDGSGVEGA